MFTSSGEERGNLVSLSRNNISTIRNGSLTCAQKIVRAPWLPGVGQLINRAGSDFPLAPNPPVRRRLLPVEAGNSCHQLGVVKVLKRGAWCKSIGSV
jgi:hypothetical protein